MGFGPPATFAFRGIMAQPVMGCYGPSCDPRAIACQWDRTLSRYPSFQSACLCLAAMPPLAVVSRHSSNLHVVLDLQIGESVGVRGVRRWQLGAAETSVGGLSAAGRVGLGQQDHQRYRGGGVGRGGGSGMGVLPSFWPQALESELECDCHGLGMHRVGNCVDILSGAAADRTVSYTYSPSALQQACLVIRG